MRRGEGFFRAFADAPSRICGLVKGGRAWEPPRIAYTMPRLTKQERFALSLCALIFALAAVGYVVFG